MTGRRTRRDFEPESSWRVVEAGFNDSFETSVLPDEDANDVNPSQSFASTQPYSQSFSAGASQQWSIGGSQDDSLESFVSRAEYDDRVLLRSPFRPSIPKEVRESSRENMASKVRASLREKEANGLRRRRRSVSASSREDDSYPPTQNEELSGDNSRTATLLGTLARYAMIQLALLVSLGAVFYFATGPFNVDTAAFTESISPLICRLPGASSLDLSMCSAHKKHHGTEEGLNTQPFDMDPFLGIQVEFARTVEQALGVGRMQLNMELYNEAVRDLEAVKKSSDLDDEQEIDQHFSHYFNAVKSAGLKFWPFDNALRGAVGNLLQLCGWAVKELAEENDDLPHWAGKYPWASRVYSWFIPAKLSEQLVLDTYAKHLDDVFDRVNDVVGNGRRLLKELDTAGEHLEKTHSLAREEHQNSKKNQGFGDFVKSWFRAGGSKEAIEEQLNVLDELSQQHSRMKKQIGELISKSEDTLTQLYTLKKAGLVGQEVNQPLEHYVSKLTAQSNKLADIVSRLTGNQKPQ
ncbi:hypothetical protein QBC43DRAFT_50634 [Cladorrhinum sp. PSN259]|nr:hypothetical protein QBC43DRAFT_50634 [Cladorrhinum sp. PSN259]